MLVVKPLFSVFLFFFFAARPHSHRGGLQEWDRRAYLRENYVTGKWFGKLSVRLGLQIYHELLMPG